MKHIVKLLGFLFRLTRQLRLAHPVIGIVLVTSMLAGLANTGVLVLINSVLDDLGASDPTAARRFLVLCLCLLFLRSVPQILLTDLTQRALAEWRLKTCRLIVSSPLRHLEKLGHDRLLASLTNDIDTIAGALSSIPGIFMQTIVVLGCLIYLAWLSPLLLLGLGVFLFLVIVVEELPLAKGRPFQRRARETLDSTFHHLRALTAGTKEMKMHYPRRRAFLSEDLAATTRALMGYNLRWRTYFIASNSLSQVLGYVLVGLLLFAVPKVMSVDNTLVIRYIVTSLYFVGPFGILIRSLQGLSTSSVALEKMRELGFSLEQESQEPGAGDRYATQPSWRRLELMGVTHSYHREGEAESFTLGPIDLSFEPGQLVFIVGGNGSGKTTLAKLLLGLYSPESGQPLLDGEPVHLENRDLYRQRFSAVFTDFYLFERLFGLREPTLESRTETYLHKLQLERKVEIADGRISTLELSQGQRKRLALLTAYLEDREIYLFDEWAADQDPAFKQIFYHQLLPDLKARGKTVLVISHDDHYYHVADRIIKLQDGRVESDRSRATIPTPPPARDEVAVREKE